jgi:two-component sensor histidine kinase
MRVIILDDNPDDRALVRHELKALYPEAQAVELSDGAGLEAALDEGMPTLVITDLDLRWTSGLDVLKRIKDGRCRLPGDHVYGTGDETVAVEAMKAGLDDYVVKSPRQLPRLRASVRQVVEGAERKRTLRQTEQQLRAALDHKDLVLRELHHRVKNNIQTMTSLLWLSAKQARTEESRAELNDLLNRMQVFGRVQARIYETEELDQVDFGAVLRDVATSLVDVYGASRISLRLAGEAGLQLPVQRAMPLALLVYELILNALKHGFPETASGILRVEIDAQHGSILVADNGSGAAGDAKPGVGTRLVEALGREAQVIVERNSRPGEGTEVVVRLG